MTMTQKQTRIRITADFAYEHHSTPSDEFDLLTEVFEEAAPVDIVSIKDTRETGELVETILSRIDEIVEGDFEKPDCTRQDAVRDLHVDLGWMSDNTSPHQWFEVANAIYDEYDIDDWEYNRALARVLKPGKIPSEAASAYVNPANTVPMLLTAELMFPAVGADPLF